MANAAYTCSGCGRAIPCRHCPDGTPTVAQKGRVLPQEPKWTIAQRYEDVIVCLDHERSRTSRIVRGEPVRDVDECQGATNAALRRLYSAIEGTEQSESPQAVFSGRFSGPDTAFAKACAWVDEHYPTASGGYRKRLIEAHQAGLETIIQAKREVTDAMVKRACEVIMESTHVQAGAQDDNEDTSSWECCKGMRVALEAALNG